MGLKTQAAMAQYQNDKGLPVGNLNIETLKALGVEGQSKSVLPIQFKKKS